MYQIDEIRKIDPEVAESIENEVNRQRKQNRADSFGEFCR